MANVKLEHIHLPASPNDPFQQFRDVALLEVKQQFDYRHSLGKTSRFFLALKDGKLLATKCPSCASVYMPPRAVCPKDLQPTEWLELSGVGTLHTWTLCSQAIDYAHTEVPYILAYVRLEGTDSLFLHQLRNASPKDLVYGGAVKVVFSQRAVHHPLEYFWFELLI